LGRVGRRRRAATTRGPAGGRRHSLELLTDLVEVDHDDLLARVEDDVDLLRRRVEDAVALGVPAAHRGAAGLRQLGRDVGAYLPALHEERQRHRRLVRLVALAGDVDLALEPVEEGQALTSPAARGGAAFGRVAAGHRLELTAPSSSEDDTDGEGSGQSST